MKYIEFQHWKAISSLLPSCLRMLADKRVLAVLVGYEKGFWQFWLSMNHIWPRDLHWDTAEVSKRHQSQSCRKPLEKVQASDHLGAKWWLLQGFSRKHDDVHHITVWVDKKYYSSMFSAYVWWHSDGCQELWGWETEGPVFGIFRFHMPNAKSWQEELTNIHIFKYV